MNALQNLSTNITPVPCSHQLLRQSVSVFLGSHVLCFILQIIPWLLNRFCYLLKGLDYAQIDIYYHFAGRLVYQIKQVEFYWCSRKFWKIYATLLLKSIVSFKSLLFVFLPSFRIHTYPYIVFRSLLSQIPCFLLIVNQSGSKWTFLNVSYFNECFLKMFNSGFYFSNLSIPFV